MAASASVFPTFFLSGFECSTFDWMDRGRRNLVAETRHLEHAQEDYAFLRSLGVGGRLNDAPLSDPVDLEDIRAAARRMPTQPDANWA